MLAAGHASYVLGQISGALLLAIFAAALALALRPMIRERDRRFAIALAIALVVTAIKLVLLRNLPGVTVDLAQFELWGQAMLQQGPAHIYDPLFNCKYTPAYLYPLWAAAALSPDWPDYMRMSVEAPAILADLMLAITVYAAARLAGQVRSALPAAVLTILNPALFYSSTVWGQNDSAIAFPVLLSIVMAAESRYALAWAIAIFAALVKAQGLMLLPLLAWWTLINGRIADWLRSAAAAVAIAAIVIAPFQLGHPWHFASDVYLISIDSFPWASVNGFNLMLALGGLIVLDSDRLFGRVSYFMLGNLLFAASYLVAAWIAWQRRTAWNLMFAAFIVYLGMFIFAPRMHERYLYYAVALLAPLIFSSRTTLALYVILSLTLLLNMAYVWLELVYVPGFVEGHLLIDRNGRLAIALINVAAFLVAAVYGLRMASAAGAEPAGVRRS